MGAVDRLHALGIPCFGPEAKAARIESSKVFSKELMKKYHIPTAAYEVFDCAQTALEYVSSKNREVAHCDQGGRIGSGQGRIHLHDP